MQFTTQQKIPKVGHGVASWQVKRTDPGNESYSIRVRNDTTVPIQVTRIHLANCLNLRIPCDSITPTPLVVAPGGSEDVISFTPAVPGRKTRFIDSIDWGGAPECLHVDSSRGAAQRHTSPTNGRLVLPPRPPHQLETTSAEVTFFIAASGAIDSLRVNGVADSSYLKTLESAMRRYAFGPARIGKCPVPGSARIFLTFGSPQSP